MAQTTNEGNDRISALPDSLVHHIVSFLDTKDAFHTSILSNRWKYVWLSTPNLNFNLDWWMRDYGKREYMMWMEDKNTFIDFVEKVLNLRGGFKVVKFNLQSYGESLHATRVYSWVIAALKHCVRHLCVDIPINGLLELPEHLFTSDIRVLEVRNSCCKLPVQLPNSMCAAALIKDLRLNRARLPDGNADGELILSCPSLEILMISNCDVSHLKVLTISTPLLESLEFASLYTDENNSCEVKTFTPNLKSLILLLSTNYSIADYSLGDLPSLFRAHIDIGCPKKAVAVKQSYECLVKVMLRIYNVRVLKLSVSSIQVLTDSRKLLERLPVPLHNLEYEMFMDEFHAPCARVLHFLERFPHLETLVWKRYSGSKQEEEWVANFPFQSIFSHLKSFEIQNFQGIDFEVKFVEFVLERAILLKKMTIKTTRSFFSDERLTEFKEKLLLPRASFSASISCQFQGSQDLFR